MVIPWARASKKRERRRESFGAYVEARSKEVGFHYSPG